MEKWLEGKDFKVILDRHVTETEAQGQDDLGTEEVESHPVDREEPLESEAPTPHFLGIPGSAEPTEIRSLRTAPMFHQASFFPNTTIFTNTTNHAPCEGNKPSCLLFAVSKDTAQNHLCTRPEPC